MLILRRLCIAAIAVTVDEPMLQGSATLIVLVVMLAAQTFAKPFIDAKTDLLDFAALCCSMLYTMAGMLFYPSVTQRAQGHLCAHGSDNAFCAKDSAVKDTTAVIALLMIVLT